MATNKNYMPHQLGLIAQIILYLIPGIVIFLFLPSLIFSYFENWSYSVAIYYSFVTLSTIGFGDFVPTFADHQVWSLLISWKDTFNQNYLIPGRSIRYDVLCIRNIHHFLVYIWSRLSCDDNGIHSQVRCYI